MKMDAKFLLKWFTREYKHLKPEVQAMLNGLTCVSPGYSFTLSESPKQWEGRIVTVRKLVMSF